MLLDPNDFEQVWEHIAACARRDQEEGNLIESFARRGGNRIEDVQPEKIRVRSLRPKGKGFRCLPKSQFRDEWEKLVRGGSSSDVHDQIVWDMLERYFEDIERGRDRGRLRWTGFPISRR